MPKRLRISPLLILRRAGALALVAFLVVATVGAVRTHSLSRAISGRGLLASDVPWGSGEARRFNLLVLGYGGWGFPEPYKTDPMLLYSVPLDGGRPVLLGIPPDLWVEYPARSGRHRRIDAVFPGALSTLKRRAKAARATSGAVSRTVGVPVDAWITIDTVGFRRLVDALGGLELDAPRPFAASYPVVADGARRKPRWTTVRFAGGEQRVNGAAAVRYGRAVDLRDPLGRSDADRTARQHQLASAIRAELRSAAGWSRVLGLMSAAERGVLSSLPPADLARLLARGDAGVQSVILSREHVLAPSVVGQEDAPVLLPRDGDWDALHRYVRAKLGDPRGAETGSARRVPAQAGGGR